MTEPGDISDLVYADRYAWPGESLRIDTYRRVAIALAAREAGPERERHAALFLENFLAGAIGAGRIMANAGAADGDGDGGATMVNCFVQPAIDPGLGWPQGLDAALARAVRTMSMGGGVGYDFSPVPPADSGAGRGGACAVIDRYDQACQAWPRRPGAGGRADGRAGLRSSRPARLPARQGRTAPLADPEPVGRAERPLPAGRGERRGVDPAPCLPAGGRTGITARRAWRPWNMALCRLAGAAAVGGADRRGLPGR